MNVNKENDDARNIKPEMKHLHWGGPKTRQYLLGEGYNEYFFWDDSRGIEFQVTESFIDNNRKTLDEAIGGSWSSREIVTYSSKILNTFFGEIDVALKNCPGVGFTMNASKSYYKEENISSISQIVLFSSQTSIELLKLESLSKNDFLTNSKGFPTHICSKRLKGRNLFAAIELKYKNKVESGSTRLATVLQFLNNKIDGKGEEDWKREEENFTFKATSLSGSFTGFPNISNVDDYMEFLKKWENGDEDYGQEAFVTTIFTDIHHLTPDYKEDQNFRKFEDLKKRYKDIKELVNYIGDVVKQAQLKIPETKTYNTSNPNFKEVYVMESVDGWTRILRDDWKPLLARFESTFEKMSEGESEFDEIEEILELSENISYEFLGIRKQNWKDSLNFLEAFLRSVYPFESGTSGAKYRIRLLYTDWYLKFHNRKNQITFGKGTGGPYSLVELQNHPDSGGLTIYNPTRNRVIEFQGFNPNNEYYDVGVAKRDDDLSQKLGIRTNDNGSFSIIDNKHGGILKLDYNGGNGKGNVWAVKSSEPKLGKSWLEFEPVNDPWPRK